jgi:hypothetical protein
MAVDFISDRHPQQQILDSAFISCSSASPGARGTICDRDSGTRTFQRLNFTGCAVPTTGHAGVLFETESSGSWTLTHSTLTSSQN